MIRPVVVLRPEPGSRATIERLHAAGLPALSLPLFQVAPLDWTPPSPGGFDRLLLTSANAVRHGGAALAKFHALSVLAVGSATAAAVREAGFHHVTAGPGDLAGLLATIDPSLRLLWLAGADRTAIEHPAIATVVPVYRATACELTPAQAASLKGTVVLVHSARAGAQLAAQVKRHAMTRADIRVAAISAKAAVAAGSGWAQITVAPSPDDPSLIDAARGLAIDP